MFTRSYFRLFRPVVLGLVCLALSVAGSLRAGNVKYPAETPILSVEVPDGWTAEISKGDLDMTTEDGNVYFSLSKNNGSSKLEPTVSAKKFKEGAGLTDLAVEANDDEEANGVKKRTALVTGKKNGTDYFAIVGTIALPDGTKCALFVLGEKESMIAHKKELAVINGSIKAAK